MTKNKAASQKQSQGKYAIELCSDQLAKKEWSPKAILREDRKYEIQEKPLVWKKNFTTKKEADAYALAQAKLWIERNI